MLWTVIIPYVILYALVVALPPYLLEWNFFEQFKISKDPWPWKDKREGVREEFWKLTRRSLLIDSVNLLVFVPFYVSVKVVLFPSRALSFSVDDWPTYWESFSVILTSVVVHEFGFYWT
jgi:ABC-type polysaccharide transport system permease subunit